MDDLTKEQLETAIQHQERHIRLLSRETLTEQEYFNMVSVETWKLVAMNRLKELEQGIEDGTTTQLPCPYSSDVYFTTLLDDGLIKGKINKFILYEHRSLVEFEYHEGYVTRLVNDHNKAWFTSKKEAEQALKEMEGENE